MSDMTIEIGNTSSGADEEAVQAVIGAVEVVHDDRPASMAGELVPIVLFLAIAWTYCIKYYFAYRSRRDAQSTMRAAIEHGEPLAPELLDRLLLAVTGLSAAAIGARPAWDMATALGREMVQLGGLCTDLVWLLQEPYLIPAALVVMVVPELLLWLEE